MRKATSKTSRKQSDNEVTDASMQNISIPKLVQAVHQQYQTGDLQQAKKLCQQVLEIEPDNIDANHLLGAIASLLGNNSTAIELLTKTIRLSPQNAEARSNLGTVFKKLGQYEEAITLYKKAIAIEPGYAAAYSNLGNVLKKLGQYEEAITFYKKAIAIKPDYAEAYNNLGTVSIYSDKLDEEENYYQKALQIKPDYPDAQFNWAMVLLRKGDFKAGWEKYHYRFQKKEVASKYSAILSLPMPQWQGEPLNGKTILVWDEQGLGDTIQFVRYLEKIKDNNVTTLFRCKPDLKRLFQNISYIDKFVGNIDIASTDYHVPLMSLPQIYHTTLETIPNHVPYIDPDSGLIEQWRERLKEDDKFRVGLVWAGSPTHNNDRFRSLALKSLLPLLTIEGISVYSLQKGQGAEQIQSLEKGIRPIDMTEQINDLADTAALIANLDLVISVDTCVAHLAGAMGHLAWILLPASPDWRWLLEREDSPWYPTMHLYRQQRLGEWAPVIEIITRDLESLAKDKTSEIKKTSPSRVIENIQTDSVKSTADSIRVGSHKQSITQAIQKAFEHCQAGQFQRAESICQQGLSVEPDNIDANHLLGIISAHLGNNEMAISLLQKTIKLNPEFADAYTNLGTVFRRLHKIDAAIDCYEKAISIKPNYMEAYSDLGDALRSSGKLDEAIACYEKAISIRPDYESTHNNLGNAFKEKGRIDEAIVCYERAIAIRPDYANAHNNLGNVFKEKERVNEAIACYEKAIAIKSDHADAYSNLGVVLLESEKHEEAITLYKKAIAIDLGHAAANSNLANVLSKFGRYEEAITLYEKAIAIKPDYAEAYNNLGTAFSNIDLLDEAEDSYQKALQIKPNYPDAQFNWAMVLLRKGDFKGGWEKYHYRFQRKEVASKYSAILSLPIPQWQGEPLNGKTILVWDEQGLGDTIQFVRYLEKIKDHNVTILFRCKPALNQLLQNISSIDKFVESTDTMSADYHAPLMSLPKIYHTTLETIPHHAPYLDPDSGLVEQWRERLKEDNKFKVGLAWAGSPTHDNDHFRSILLKAFSPLLNIEGINVYSLQKGQGAEQIQDLAEELQPIDMTEQINDLADTAALIANLDLVISVDTCVVHLAGAMGRSVWTVLPASADWRWLLKREDSPWYPTMHLYRQHQLGEWSPVIELITHDLKNLAKDMTSEIKISSPSAVIYPPQKDSVKHKENSIRVGSHELSIIQALQKTLEHHQAGELTLAESICQQVLSIEPDNIDANHLLGVVSGRLGKKDTAIKLLQKTIELKPEFSDAHNNLGNVFRNIGELDVAISCFKKAISINADYAEAFNNMGIARGEAGETDKAIADYIKAISINPNYVEAYNNMGITYKETGKIDQAIANFNKAISINPDYAKAHNNLGNALKEKGRLDKAIACYEKAISINADYAGAFNNLAIAHDEAGRTDKAIANFKKAVSINPNYSEAYNNFGVVLKKLWQYEEAIISYKKAIAINPGYAEAYNNLGTAFSALVKLDEAENAYKKALQLVPDYPDAQFNWALTLLQKGDFKAGWEKYQYRFQRKEVASKYHTLPTGQWQGEPLNGKTIYIWDEQGLGDTIQFVRYLEKIKENNVTIIFKCKPVLSRLLETIPHIDELVQGTETTSVDYHTPLMSLPQIYNTTLDTIPSHIPYIAADPVLIAQWRERIKGDSKYRVGLVWAGNQGHNNDHFRSIPLKAFSPLLNIDGISAYSLQKGQGTEQIQDLEKKIRPIDMTEQINDLADTAALIANLDLVISVDTCVVHLAGAMGHLVWTLLPANPDWRWLLEREDSPWYPTMQLYRQQHLGEWTSVIEKIEIDLRDILKQDIPVGFGNRKK